jgi:hypothetical protein
MKSLMMVSASLIFAAALMLSGVVSAHAEVPDAKDVAVINSCLAGLGPIPVRKNMKRLAS